MHFRTPTGTLLCLRVRCRMIHQGFFEEDAVVFSGEGTVLARSRQLALVIPEAPPTRG